MTVTYQTTNSVGPGTRFSISSDDDSYSVLQDVVVASTNTRAILSNFNHTNLSIDGSVMGALNTIQLTGNNATVTVGTTGIVRNNTNSATSSSLGFLGGNHGSLVNDGQISGNRGVGVYATGPNFDFINNGSLSGSSGVLMEASHSRILNSGAIIASAYDHENQDIHYNNAVYAEARFSAITNLAGGVIAAIAPNGAGIRLGDGSQRISESALTNYGTVTSELGSGVLIQGNGNINGFVSFDNYGVVSGRQSTFSVNSSNTSLKMYNEGTLVGRVSLGDLFDTFENRGTIEGLVTLGGGDDRATNSGTIYGLLSLGAGDDEFTYDGGSISGDIFSGRGNDVVRLLNVDDGEIVRARGGQDTDTFNLKEFTSAVWIDLDYDGSNVWTRDNNAVASGNWRAIADISGFEILTGTAGVDVLRGDSSDNVFTYFGRQAIGGVDRYDGRDGSDTVSFEAFRNAIWIDLDYASSNAWTRDNIDLLSGEWRGLATTHNIENVVGTSQVDEMYGTAAENTFFYRGASSRPGVEIIDGRGGADTIDVSLFNRAVWIDLTAAIEVATQDDFDVVGGTWRNIADLTSIENITGSVHDDELRGDAGDNVINGGGGDDLLIGRGGFDTFVFEDRRDGFGVDEIRGFHSNNSERIDLSQVAQITDFADLTSNYLFDVGGTAHIVIDGNNTIILTGWTVADFGVAAGITADDFIF